MTNDTNPELFISMPSADHAALSFDQQFGLASHLSDAMNTNVNVYVGGSDYRVWSYEDHVCPTVSARLIAIAAAWCSATTYF